MKFAAMHPLGKFLHAPNSFRGWFETAVDKMAVVRCPHCRTEIAEREILFDHAAITISGIELAEKIKKGQFQIGKLRNRKATMSEQWSAALAA